MKQIRRHFDYISRPLKAVLDTNECETGVKVTKSQMEAVCIRRHKTHPDWNYTFEPRAW